MKLRQFAMIFAVLVAIEASVFAYYYDDLLFLRRPMGFIVAGSPDDFRDRAERALARERLTRSHLETIAHAATAFGSVDLEVRALERLALDYRSDRSVRLRLADALRRAGQYGRAERLYREALDTEPGSPR